MNLNNDELCLILSNFNRFDEFSGFVLSCKKMNEFWKKIKSRFIGIYELKLQKSGPIRMWATKSFEKIEITIEKLNWQRFNKVEGIQYLKDFQYKLSLKIETKVDIEGLDTAEIKAFYKGCIKYIKEECDRRSKFQYSCLEDVELFNSACPINTGDVCFNGAGWEIPFKKHDQFQSIMTMKINK